MPILITTVLAFTNIAGATVNAAGQTLNITGDVAIGAATNATTVISDSDGGGIGLGSTAVGGFQLSGAELQRLPQPVRPSWQPEVSPLIRSLLPTATTSII